MVISKYMMEYLLKEFIFFSIVTHIFFSNSHIHAFSLGCPRAFCFHPLLFFICHSIYVLTQGAVSLILSTMLPHTVFIDHALCNVWAFLLVIT